MKILIAYASRHGTAEDCAKLLAPKLHGEVTVVNVKNNSTIHCEDYDKIIIGSPVYAGAVLKELKTFCTANEAALLQKPLDMFFACMEEDETVLKNYAKAAFSAPISEHIGLIGAFGGTYHFKKMNFIERAIIKMISKSQAKSNPDAPIIDTTKDEYSTVIAEKISAFAQNVSIA